MRKQIFKFEGLDCLCCKCDGSHEITYILYPMDILKDWIEAASEKFKSTIVVITGMDWDDDLTPWPATGVPKGCPNFKGLAGQFLVKLEAIVKEMESTLAISEPQIVRTLVGVSLSGLFTLWQWPQCSVFRNIASLSGSFWYEEFMVWFNNQKFDGKDGVAYFLLGKKESKSNVKAFQPVETNTEAIVAKLKSDGITTFYDLVPGDHYSQPIERLDEALSTLAQQTHH